MRGAAATAIGKIGTAEDGKALIPLLADESSTVRNRVLQAIGVLQGQGGGPALRELYEANRRKELGRAILAALSRIGDPAQADLFQELVQDPDPERKRLAVEGLGRISDASRAARLQEGLPAREERGAAAGLQLRPHPAGRPRLPRHASCSAALAHAGHAQPRATSWRWGRPSCPSSIPTSTTPTPRSAPRCATSSRSFGDPDAIPRLTPLHQRPERDGGRPGQPRRGAAAARRERRPSR